MRKIPFSRLRKVAVWPALLVVLIVGTSLIAPHFPHPYNHAPEQFARQLVAQVGEIVYQNDRREAERLAQRYYIGKRPQTIVPFVFESPDTPFLVQFRDAYRLDDIIRSEQSEYTTMLMLASWVANQFEHGTDAVPGGTQVCDPTAVVAAGRRGAAFWCEIAARTMVHAATAVGWPARVITGSTTGYSWDHAVAELWSNQFNKWIAIDTDFNVVFESNGIPLSAYELSHSAEQLRLTHQLQIRQFAPFKKGLVKQDLLRLYAYVHVDLRTDWCSRILPRGSPAGGDKATWWTARPGARPLMSPSPMVDDQQRFDWPLNQVRFESSDHPDGGRRILLSTYSPVFAHFEYRQPGLSPVWQKVTGEILHLPSDHAGSVEVRVVTKRGDRGPIARLDDVSAASER